MKDGKVVKGVNFVGIKEVGDPVEFARKYCGDGADELTILDITATVEGRKSNLEIVGRVKEAINIPLAMGGGIRRLSDIEDALRAGADKVGINTAAIKDKNLLKEAAREFGSDKIILAVDAKRKGDGTYSVYINGGRDDSGIELVGWVKEAEQLGAGELLPTSMDTDGMTGGYDIELYNRICDAVKIPVTASGGCGKLEDIKEVFDKTGVDAVLAASVFHYGTFTVRDVKQYLGWIK
ncbi:MAG: imidazole glycerol phosphate synthase cyclase subunit [Oscillospiraceae bacterium]|nr:imidazole glycerol phosphate synthase cyclase subunit [Oscillospiraceae bacterium]